MNATTTTARPRGLSDNRENQGPDLRPRPPRRSAYSPTMAACAKAVAATAGATNAVELTQVTQGASRKAVWVADARPYSVAAVRVSEEPVPPRPGGDDDERADQAGGVLEARDDIAGTRRGYPVSMPPVEQICDTPLTSGLSEITQLPERSENHRVAACQLGLFASRQSRLSQR